MAAAPAAMVPEIAPVEGSMARPGGRPVADQARACPSGSLAGVGSSTLLPSPSARSAAGWSNAGGRLVLAMVQVKVSVANKPAGSCTRTTTAYGDPAAAS